MSEHEPYNIDRILKETTAAALRSCNGNRTMACKRLGISIRTLRNWIRKYQLREECPPYRYKPDPTAAR